MPQGIRYSEDFKRDSVGPIIDPGYSVQDVSDRLGITTKSLYAWKVKFSQPKAQTDQDIEVRKFKAELVGGTEERDILNLEGSKRILFIIFLEQGHGALTDRVLRSNVPRGYSAKDAK